MERKWHVGMRTIKSAIALSICAGIRLLLARESTLLLTTAVICMYPTVETAIKSGIGRMIATGIGAVTGFVVLLFYMLVSNHLILQIVFMPLGVIFAIQVCNILKLSTSSVIAAIVVIAISVSYSTSIGTAASYSLNRLLDTAIGIIVSMLVNLFIAPYKEEKEAKKSVLDEEDTVKKIEEKEEAAD